MMKLSLASLVAIALLVQVPAAAFAAPVSATEVLEDAEPFDLAHRDLKRTLTDSAGTTVIDSDAAITASNAVDSDFGIYNLSDVTYRHNLTWLNPPAATYLTGSLQIEAFGVDNGNDRVYSETFNLGALNNDNLFLLDGFSTTVFTNLVLNVVLSDGLLNVFIDKNQNANILTGSLDFLSVYKSTLTVRYEPVPEPASLLLLGGGLLAAALRRRFLA